MLLLSEHLLVNHPNEIRVGPTVTRTDTELSISLGYVRYDTQTYLSLKPIQRALVNANGPLAGIATGILTLLATTAVMEYIESKSFMCAVTIPMVAPFINKLQPLAIQIPAILAIAHNIFQLSPFTPGTDGHGLFKELNVSDKAKKISNTIIQITAATVLTILGWAAYKTYTTR